MRVTLRKANALTNALQDAVRQIEFKTNVKLNEFEDPNQVLNTARQVLLGDINKKTTLQRVLYSIRNSVGQANHESGINSMLTEVAALEKEIQIYASLVTESVSENLTVISGKLEKIRNNKAETRRSILGYDDTVDSGVLLPEHIVDFKNIISNLKKHKQQLQDQILETNVKTEIELAGATVEVLRVEGLL